MILQNVTGNAIKYGARRARANVGGRRDGAGAWRFSVADQGPGIPLGKARRSVRPFTRGDTQGQPGVGLGLNIARQAANCLGAKLWAESDGKKGTTFHVEVRPIANDVSIHSRWHLGQKCVDRPPSTIRSIGVRHVRHGLPARS